MEDELQFKQLLLVEGEAEVLVGNQKYHLGAYAITASICLSSLTFTHYLQEKSQKANAFILCNKTFQRDCRMQENGENSTLLGPFLLSLLSVSIIILVKRA